MPLRKALSFGPLFLIAGTVAVCPAWTASVLAQASARQQAQRLQPGGRQGADQSEARTNVVEEDQKKIDQATTGTALMDLGKEFVLAQKLDAAARAVEKAVLKNPKLLEDEERQAPKAWNDFWFTHRAKLREKKLSGKDAAGRVKLALWLDGAGVTGPARAMLTAALAINKEEASAKELAEKWNIYAGGPVRFDLTMGLKEPLFATTIQDEGQGIIPRTKEKSYVIIPFACDAGGQRMLMGKGDFKVVSDDGKACAVAGFAVVERNDAGGSGETSLESKLADRGKLPELKMQAASEPLWEQIQFQAGERDKPQEMVLSNLVHPFVRPAPGKRNDPPPQPAGPTGPNKTNKTSTGYLALIVEVPDSATSVDCTYVKAGTQAKFDIELLKSLNKAVDKLTPAERDTLIAALAPQTTHKSPAAASAALRKLNEIRLGGKAQSGGGQVLKGSEAKTKLETAMIAAFTHESPLVRRDAFDLLSKDESEDLDTLIAKAGEAAVATQLLAELRAYFTEVQAVVAAAAAATNPDGTPAPRQDSSSAESTTGLLKLPLAPAVPALLSGCLNSKSAGEEALELCLANPCDQTIDLLKDASDELVGKLLTRVAQVTDPKTKAAMLRTLLRGKNRNQLPKILAAFKGAELIIEREDDPVLNLAIDEQPSAVQQPLLELLAKANLSAQGVSEKVKKLIEKYAAEDFKPDAKLQAAVLRLAEGQLKAYYSAPVKRGGQSGAGNPSPGQGAVGFDTLLASVATSPSTDAVVARQAAAKLISLGQVRALTDRFQHLQGEARDKRVRDLIQALALDKKLWEREALPVFLAMQLSSTDVATRQAALSAMTAVQAGIDPKQRWRVNLAFKQGLEAKQLVTLSMDSDEKASRAAMSLLRNLGAMTAAEAAEFAAAGDEAGRQARLGTLETDRTTKAVGTFACMVYLDVRANNTNPTGGAPASTGSSTAAVDRDNVPLESVAVNFQRGAKDGKITAFAATFQIAPPTKKQEGQPAAEPTPGSISMDAALLLRKALELPDAKKEGLAGKINPAVLRATHICELKYEQLGAWSAELTIQEPSDSSSTQYPYKLVGAKIVLEPITQ